MITIKDRINQVIQSTKKQYSDDSCFPIEVDDIVALLYAPNPSTGVPDPSLGLVMSGKGDPQLTEYVKDHLFIVGNQVGGSSLSADEALSDVVPFDFQFGSERQEVAKFYLNKINEYKKSLDHDD